MKSLSEEKAPLFEGFGQPPFAGFAQPLCRSRWRGSRRPRLVLLFSPFSLFGGLFSRQDVKLAVAETKLLEQQKWTEGFKARFSTLFPTFFQPFSRPFRQAEAIFLREELGKAHPFRVEIVRLCSRVRWRRRRSER